MTDLSSAVSLAATVVADVVGYSRLMEADEVLRGEPQGTPSPALSNRQDAPTVVPRSWVMDFSSNS